MADNLEIGQIVKTLGRQITVPDWYGYNTGFKEGQDALDFSNHKRTDIPVIRLVESMRLGHGASNIWNINTNQYRQSGLVCFVSEEYLGMAIISVRIVKVSERSVTAEPIEWIEVNPKLDFNYIGQDAQEVFDEYLEKVIEKIDGDKDFDEQDTSCLDYRAIWHNKEYKE